MSMNGYYSVVDNFIIGHWQSRFEIISKNAKRGIYVVKKPYSRTNVSGIRGMPHYISSPTEFVVLEVKEKNGEHIRLEELVRFPARA